MVYLLAVATCMAAAVSTLVETTDSPSIVSEAGIAARLDALYRDRAQAIVRGDTGNLASHYDLESAYGRWALDREHRRTRYVEAWSKARGVRFVGASARIKVDAVEVRGDTAWLRLRQSAGFAYVHDADPHAPPDNFGIGTRHSVELVRRNGTWLVRRDWYTDPLDEDSIVADVRPSPDPTEGHAPKTQAPAPGEHGHSRESTDTPHSAGTSASPGGHEGPVRPSVRQYDRARAVAYADRYCGFAWGGGNDGEYNPKYKDFTGLGGDCTNFVSQVLGDADAGGLPMDWTWHYTLTGPGAGPSRAWAQAEALVGYLIASGRATRLARGTYPEVAAPLRQLANGHVGALRPGDIVAYEERGRIQHLAIVTGTDSHGYIVVNSHTADRYHVPWDLGWDRGTVFWLLSITR
jgi:hypothetical protein